jgi:UDP-2,3-diacylglucosamine pyrophosphatase LpxH
MEERSFRVLERSFALAIRLNPTIVNLYYLSSFFELEHGKGISTARSVLYHGLRINTHHPLLYYYFFLLELTHYKNRLFEDWI